MAVRDHRPPMNKTHNAVRAPGIAPGRNKRNEDIVNYPLVAYIRASVVVAFAVDHIST